MVRLVEFVELIGLIGLVELIELIELIELVEWGGLVGFFIKIYKGNMRISIKDINGKNW